MKEKEFKIWLENHEIERKATTIANRIANCKSVINAGYDLDEEYKTDKGIQLLEKFTYSKQQFRNDEPVKHKVTITGNKYTNTSTFKSAINLYFTFLNSYEPLFRFNEKEKKSINTIEDDKNLSDKEKNAWIKYRIGQTGYRVALLELWNNCCSVTNNTVKETLVASHIKPWSESNNTEKVDKYNGLLLTSNLDKLFDNYLISFKDNGKILISTNRLTNSQKQYLNLSLNMKLKEGVLINKHLPYIEHHRNEFLKREMNYENKNK
jgi:hypothetical protein